MMMALNWPELPSIGSVASLLSMDLTTLTAALKLLQRRELVRVMVDGEDRRGRRLKLTPAGRALLATAPYGSGSTRMPKFDGLSAALTARVVCRKALQALG